MKQKKTDTHRERGEGSAEVCVCGGGANEERPMIQKQPTLTGGVLESIANTCLATTRW